MCVCVCVCVCVCLCVSVCLCVYTYIPVTLQTTPFCLNGDIHTSCRKQRPMTSVRMTYIRTP